MTNLLFTSQHKKDLQAMLYRISEVIREVMPEHSSAFMHASLRVGETDKGESAADLIRKVMRDAWKPGMSDEYIHGAYNAAGFISAYGDRVHDELVPSC